MSDAKCNSSGISGSKVKFLRISLVSSVGFWSLSDVRRCIVTLLNNIKGYKSDALNPRSELKASGKKSFTTTGKGCRLQYLTVATDENRGVETITLQHCFLWLFQRLSSRSPGSSFEGWVCFMRWSIKITSYYTIPRNYQPQFNSESHRELIFSEYLNQAKTNIDGIKLPAALRT